MTVTVVPEAITVEEEEIVVGRAVEIGLSGADVVGEGEEGISVIDCFVGETSRNVAVAQAIDAKIHTPKRAITISNCFDLVMTFSSLLGRYYII